MASTDHQNVVQRLHDSKPPATDSATYLTIIEMSLAASASEILPALRDILDDVALTADIGWDLVEMLIAVPGSESCLERVAYLGNPREVILKVLQVMAKLSTEDEDEDEDEDEIEDENGPEEQADDDRTKPDNQIHSTAKPYVVAHATTKTNGPSPTRQFVILCGMLAVLHRRLKVRAPSRFLHTTMDTVIRCYDASKPAATAAVISLVRSLSGQKRPPLPKRKSSTATATLQSSSPFPPGDDATKSAPDPEEVQDQEQGSEEAGDAALVQRLLQVFVTCVLEAFVNSNELEWPSRLLELTCPEKIVLGRMTQMQAFKDLEELKARDELVGQLVSLAGDVGLSRLSSSTFRESFATCPISICTDALSVELDSDKPEAMSFSTGGLASLVAYWMFASDLFDAQHSIPDLHIFPSHHTLLRNFVGDSPQERIAGNPGSVEALLAMGIWLHTQSRLVASSSSSSSSSTTKPDFMSYHHLVTLIGVFHPNPRARQSAITLAGHVLHAAPETERLTILEDLLENCMFSSLQACAVSWVKDEMVLAAAQRETRSLTSSTSTTTTTTTTIPTTTTTSSSRFATPECLDALQYALFPDLRYLEDEEQDAAALLEFWAQAWPFHLQAANFARFVLGQESAYRCLVPAGMAAAVENRYVEPLLHLVAKLKGGGDGSGGGDGGGDGSGEGEGGGSSGGSGEDEGGSSGEGKGGDAVVGGAQGGLGTFDILTDVLGRIRL